MIQYIFRLTFLEINYIQKVVLLLELVQAEYFYVLECNLEYQIHYKIRTVIAYTV